VGVRIVIQSPPVDEGRRQRLVTFFTNSPDTLMNLVACAAPLGSIDPAPMTSLPELTETVSATLSAFWSADDCYYVRAEGSGGTTWYRIEQDVVQSSEASIADRSAIASLMADIIPMGGSRVAFPVGSTGRTVFRVWRSRSASERPARTKILAVRAARSRRLPA
jgi:hypothetical protein